LARPHEDREKHTLVDHRDGGLPVAFAPESWVAIGIAHVKADRNDACVAAYETLVEKARTSNVHANPAAIFASQNERRVVTMVGVQGHDGFRHLSAAWDDHHRNAQHRAISESVSFALYKVVAHTGNADVDPAAHDAYVYERAERAVPNVAELFSSLNTSLDFAARRSCTMTLHLRPSSSRASHTSQTTIRSAPARNPPSCSEHPANRERRASRSARAKR
jgi:hypothetical protein